MSSRRAPLAGRSARARTVTRVAIAGGGLGGLAAAAFLHQAGVPAVVSVRLN